MGRGGSGRPVDPGAGDGWWSELSTLVEHLEEETSRVEGRPPRSSLEVWAEIERLERRPAAPEPGSGRSRYR